MEVKLHSADLLRLRRIDKVFTTKHVSKIHSRFKMDTIELKAADGTPELTVSALQQEIIGCAKRAFSSHYNYYGSRSFAERQAEIMVCAKSSVGPLRKLMRLMQSPATSELFRPELKPLLVDALECAESALTHHVPKSRGPQLDGFQLGMATELVTLWEKKFNRVARLHKGSGTELRESEHLVEGDRSAKSSDFIEFVFACLAPLWPGVNKDTIYSWARDGLIVSESSPLAYAKERRNLKALNEAWGQAQGLRQQQTAGDKHGPLPDNQ